MTAMPEGQIKTTPEWEALLEWARTYDVSKRPTWLILDPAFVAYHFRMLYHPFYRRRPRWMAGK